jgi:hypothetical protein
LVVVASLFTAVTVLRARRLRVVLRRALVLAVCALILPVSGRAAAAQNTTADDKVSSARVTTQAKRMRVEVFMGYLSG